MNIEKNKQYIIVGTQFSNDNIVKKISFKEITQNTFLIYDEDLGTQFRVLKDHFYNNWKIIEELNNGDHVRNVKFCFCGEPYDTVARDNRVFYECKNGHID